MIARNFSFQNCESPFSAWLSTAEAKNGDKQFWKEGFHATKGKAEHAQVGWVGGWEGGLGGGGLFFVFLPCSISACAISPGEKQ
jgi:hypothetical protein